MFNKFDKIIFSATFLSFLLSNYLWFNGYQLEGIYVGIWVLSIIVLGIYFKLLRIVKFRLQKAEKLIKDLDKE